ncbi:ferredoxin family protein [Gemmata sp. JC717]|uniref:ATP-binding protein n=1 Tax=Gemmata algarum TaxID=2975278 RepID=UPI0021BB9828|nr:ferredoxin family protein [Gemmata algarum]MDY3555503.1 ferredoxin family protein [Gemmata algarum]
MSRSRLTVVLSQAPGKHPVKRALEESIVASLLLEPELEVSVVPNLYDLGPDHTGRLFLESVRGDMVVLSWLYPRAAFWLLDRDGIKGHFGETKLKPPSDEEDDADTDTPVEKPEAIGPSGTIPDRHIYTLDLRDSNKHEAFGAEIRRIAAECRDRRAAKAREKATNNPPVLQLGLSVAKPEPELPPAQQAFAPEALLAPAGRRWYPVIDYSRCTNCLECLDFCLFGVYGVDSLERILVENQDQCKKGCPACSRVCPQQAIIFPEYKSAAIAGAETGAVGGLKIDLSRLFGGDVGDALGMAVQERDRELVNDGRSAVGATVGLPKRQADRPSAPKDDLDKLVDDLDSLGL